MVYALSLGNVANDFVVPSEGDPELVKLKGNLKAGIAETLLNVDSSMVTILYVGLIKAGRRQHRRRTEAGTAALNVEFEIKYKVPAEEKDSAISSMSAAVDSAVTSGEMVSEIVKTDADGALGTDVVADGIVLESSNAVIISPPPVVFDDDEYGGSGVQAGSFDIMTSQMLVGYIGAGLLLCGGFAGIAYAVHEHKEAKILEHRMKHKNSLIAAAQLDWKTWSTKSGSTATATSDML
jgi:hypothetical protein